MKLSGLNLQQNKPSFGDYKVEIQNGALSTFMKTLKGSFVEKGDAISDVVEFTNRVKIKHNNQGTIVLSNFNVDNESNKFIPIFSFDALVDGNTINKKVGGIKHPAIVYPSQVLDKLQAGINMLKVDLFLNR